MVQNLRRKYMKERAQQRLSPEEIMQQRLKIAEARLTRLSPLGESDGTRNYRRKLARRVGLESQVAVRRYDLLSYRSLASIKEQTGVKHTIFEDGEYGRERDISKAVEKEMKKRGIDPTERVLGRNASYERGLFKEGVLNVNLENYVERNLRKAYKQWKKDGSGREFDRKYERKELETELPWLTKYNGKVPASWDIWWAITHAMEDARLQNVQLSPVLIDAALDHDHPGCVGSAGLNQRLNFNQLIKVFSRYNYHKDDEIEIAQKQFGVNPSIVSRARKLATKERF